MMNILNILLGGSIYRSSVVEESAAGGSGAAADAARMVGLDAAAVAATEDTGVDQSGDTISVVVQDSNLDSGVLNRSSSRVSNTSTISSMDFGGVRRPGVGGGYGKGDEGTDEATGSCPSSTFTPVPMNPNQFPRSELGQGYSGVYGGNQQKSSWSGIRSTPVAPQPGSDNQYTGRTPGPLYTSYNLNDVRSNLYI